MVLGTKGCQRMGSTQTESSVVAPWMQLTGHLVMLPEHEPSWRTGNFDGISWDLVCVRAAVVASRCHVVSLVRHRSIWANEKQSEVSETEAWPRPV
jgi:hypothetical protein